MRRPCWSTNSMILHRTYPSARHARVERMLRGDPCPRTRKVNTHCTDMPSSLKRPLLHLVTDLYPIADDETLLNDIAI